MLARRVISARAPLARTQTRILRRAAAVPRRNASSFAAERASLPNSAAEWSSYVSKRLSELPESLETAEQRKGLQQLKSFIDANPEFVAERSEEMKTFAMPHWDDKPIEPAAVKRRIHANATKALASTPISKVLKIQDEIGLLQTVNFSTNSPTTHANIKALEAKRDELLSTLLKDAKLSEQDRADIEKFQQRVAQAGIAREMKMTAADREDHAKRAQAGKEAEEALLAKILKTDQDKAEYKAQVEAKQKEYKRFEQNTLMNRLLYGQ